MELKIGFLCLFLHMVIFQAVAQNGGQLEVSIDSALAGSFHEIVYTYTVADQHIVRGGGIRMEYPVAYAETEFLFWSRPQTEDPNLLGYVSGETSNGSKVSVITYGITGGIFQCTLKDGELKKGDKLYVKYQGLAQSLARDYTVRAQERTSKDSAWNDIPNTPVIKILPQKAETIVIKSPSDLKIGEPFELSLAIMDKFGNPVKGYDGEIGFSSTDPKASIPDLFSFPRNVEAKHSFQNLNYQSPGFQKIMVRTSDNLKTSIHYSYVSKTEAHFKHYFGDTHFHTGTGTNNTGFFGEEPKAQDGNSDINTLTTEDFQKLNSGGDHRANFTTAPEAYTYARDVTLLDFASSSEHDVSLFDDKAWELSKTITDKFYEPGKFTTFYAYEWTPGITHHIIMYKDRNSNVFDRMTYTDLPALWSAFDKQQKPVLCIPHITWNFDEHTTWDHVNNTYRKLGEIYSLWNSRFLIQPGDEPQRFELGKDNKWSYQYAWDKGHRIGVVGSTDNHLGQPGANNYTIYTQHTGGLAVALSPKNDRDHLWNALENRRTYATTGTRIYVDFTVNKSPMGSEIQSTSAPLIQGKVAGTNNLKTIEVVKYSNGEYTTIFKDSPDSETVEFSFVDENFDADCFYYLRVFQISEVPGRLWSYPTNEMAWSSPVWVERI